MPVKRKAPKQRAAAQLRRWEVYFAYGFDFFGDLKAFEIAPEDVWREHGHAFLADLPPDLHQAPWAVRAYGEP